MFGIEMDGFDELEKQVRKLTDDAEALGGEHDVPLNELYPPKFMRRNTDFDSVDSMFEASGFTVDSNEDFAAIPDAEWEAFVADRTRFESWEEMQQTAAGEWAKRKLGL